MDKFKHYLIALLSLASLPILGQSNSYFKNGEGWAGETWITSNYNSFYVQQLGDTIIGGDTLVKLIKPDDWYGIDTTFLMAKNDTSILNLFISNSDYSAITDSIIIDYSRTDSITSWTSVGSQNYSAWKIFAIDTVYFAGIPKKIFHIPDMCQQSDDDYVYEGTFNMSLQPNFDGCFEYLERMICYSINDTSYYVYQEGFSNNGVGQCVVSNLSIGESKKLTFKAYPNPFEDQLTIETKDLKNSTEWIILSSDGREIKRFLLNSTISRVNLESLPSGFYYLKSTTSNQWIKLTKM